MPFARYCQRPGPGSALVHAGVLSGATEGEVKGQPRDGEVGRIPGALEPHAADLDNKGASTDLARVEPCLVAAASNGHDRNVEDAVAVQTRKKVGVIVSHGRAVRVVRLHREGAGLRADKARRELGVARQRLQY